MKYLLAVLLLALSFSPAHCFAKEKGDAVVTNGKQIAFDYTLIVNGDVIDSSVGRKPMSYTHGKGEILPGLSRGLEGMRVDEEKLIVVPPEEAYGAVNENAFREVPRSSWPANEELKIDMLIPIKGRMGKRSIARVVEIRKDTVLLNLNHPLAGKRLNFQVKIISIR